MWALQFTFLCDMEVDHQLKIHGVHQNTFVTNRILNKENQFIIIKF